MSPKHQFLNLHPCLPSFYEQILGFILMQSQGRDIFRNVHFHYIISNTTFKWNITGPKMGHFWRVSYTSLSDGLLKYLLA